ncbi:MAG: 30S ribosome-binding factor RbfA, partial [Planctomycetota bacterium]
GTMPPRHLAKMSAAVKQTVSLAILSRLRDPRVRDVTVIDAELSPDMAVAKVTVSVMGDEAKRAKCLQGLRSAKGFLRSKVGDRLGIRSTPDLVFALTDGVTKSVETSRMLDDEAARMGFARAEDGEAVADEPVGQTVFPDDPPDDATQAGP